MLNAGLETRLARLLLAKGLGLDPVFLHHVVEVLAVLLREPCRLRNIVLTDSEHLRDVLLLELALRFFERLKFVRGDGDVEEQVLGGDDVVARQDHRLLH